MSSPGVVKAPVKLNSQPIGEISRHASVSVNVASRTGRMHVLATACFAIAVVFGGIALYQAMEVYRGGGSYATDYFRACILPGFTSFAALGAGIVTHSGRAEEAVKF